MHGETSPEHRQELAGHPAGASVPLRDDASHALLRNIVQRKFGLDGFPEKFKKLWTDVDSSTRLADRELTGMTETRLFVGHLPLHVRERDVQTLFSTFGRVSSVSMKRQYAFVVKARFPVGCLL
jgi:hypothetical protein